MAIVFFFPNHHLFALLEYFSPAPYKHMGYLLDEVECFSCKLMVIIGIIPDSNEKLDGFVIL